MSRLRQQGYYSAADNYRIPAKDLPKYLVICPEDEAVNEMALRSDPKFRASMRERAREQGREFEA